MTEAARRDVLYRSAAPGLRRGKLAVYGARGVDFNRSSTPTLPFVAPLHHRYSLPQMPRHASIAHFA